MQGCRGAGAYPSGHWVKGGGHPGQVTLDIESFDPLFAAAGQSSRRIAD